MLAAFENDGNPCWPIRRETFVELSTSEETPIYISISQSHNMKHHPIEGHVSYFYWQSTMLGVCNGLAATRYHGTRRWTGHVTQWREEDSILAQSTLLWCNEKWVCHIEDSAPWRINPCLSTQRPRQNDRHFADDIFKSIFLNETIRIAMKFQWSLFPRVQWTIFQHWFRQWLGAEEAIRHIRNNDVLVSWCVYASLVLNELTEGAPFYRWPKSILFNEKNLDFDSYHWRFFLRAPLTMIQRWSGIGLSLVRRQAIGWINIEKDLWRHITSITILG